MHAYGDVRPVSFQLGNALGKHLWDNSWEQTRIAGAKPWIINRTKRTGKKAYQRATSY